MFRRKKPPTSDDGRPAPRGRTVSGAVAETVRGGLSNPLARRFRADDEPATVDLAAPPRFQPAPHAGDDPETAPLRETGPEAGRVISHDARTGKFHVHPGAEDCPVMLQGAPVRSATELRPGDTIRIGDFEFHFRNTA